MVGREDFLKEEELEQTVGLEKVAKGKGGEMRSSEEAPCSGQVSGEMEHPGDRRRMQREPLDGKGEEAVDS